MEMLQSPMKRWDYFEGMLKKNESRECNIPRNIFLNLLLKWEYFHISKNAKTS